MRIGFIICEYNPFHNGHAMHIKYTRDELHCDKIVCIMSGDIVQRGELAIADKFKRAIWAIKGGADMVVELPPQFCLGSAECFAQGAISVVASFAGEKNLSFGSECGDIKKLSTLSDIIALDFTQNKIKSYIKAGNNYPQSVAQATLDYTTAFSIGGNIASLLTFPNNTLALEYISAIKRMNADILPATLKRTNDYNSLGVDNKISSASAIRNCLEQNKKIAAKRAVPSYVYDELPIDLSTSLLFAIAKFSLAEKDFDGTFGLREGVDNRIKKALKESSNMQEFYSLVNTKRYPLASIKRILLSAIVDFKGEDNPVKEWSANYLNVLAIKKDATQLLGQTSLNTVTKPSDYERFELTDPLMRRVYALFSATKYSYESFMRFVE